MAVGPAADRKQAPLAVVMRPQPAADALARKLQALGFATLAAPALEIVPLANPILPPGAPPDIAVFISPPAVTFGLPALGGRLHNMLTASNVREVLAVGEATAAALSDARITAHAPGDARSEGLLQMPQLAAPSGKRVWIVRGQGGREHLADALRERGAEVQYVEVYARQPVPGALAQLTRRPNVFVLTSGAIFEVFASQWPARAAALGVLSAQVTDVNVVVVSQRIAQMARASGYTSVLSAEGARDAQLLACLERLLD